MTKPASYPFLAIAKRYGLDYGDVLLYADMHRTPRRGPRTEWDNRAIEAVSAIEPDFAASNAILIALYEQQAIRDGLIDWQTGEPILDISKAPPVRVDCPECNGSGWLGHGMGGDTCPICHGTGKQQRTAKG